MRKLLALMSIAVLFSSTSQAELAVNKKYYTSTGIEVEDIQIPNTTLLKYQGKSGFDVDQQGCSAVAALYSALGLSKDLEAVKNIFENWKSIVLPAAIYALATQFPYVKEALVSSQFISDFLAQVGGMGCSQVFDFINEVNGVSKEKIAECIKNSGCDESSDPNKCYLEKCGVHKSWYELVSGKTFSNLLSDSEALKKVSEALAMINPGTAFDCAMGLPNPVSTSMTKEEFDEDVQTLVTEKGMSEVEAKTLLFLRASIPKVSITSEGMGIDIPKIDGKVMTITRALNMLNEDMVSDLDTLLSDIDNATTEEEVKEKVSDFEDKYGVKLNSDFYFVVMRNVKKKLEEDCPNTLSGSPTEEEAKLFCPDRIQAFEEAKRKFSEVVSVKYALAVKEAMLRYIDQTKLYLLQQKNTGLAVCSSLSNKTLDMSEENVKAMIKQLDVLSDRVKSEVDSYLASKGVSEEDINKLSLLVSKLLAKAVDGKEHKEGEWVRFTITE